MQITVLIPHYKTGKMTAYTLSKLLEFKGNHDVKIVVIDNNAGDGSAEYLTPFLNEVCYCQYPKEVLQSHGVAYNFALENGMVDTPYFITLESDSFPTRPNWIYYYKDLIDNGCDMAASYLKLSGGSFGHPAGALYKKSLWEEMKQYCDSMPYSYFPNMAMRDNFPMHLMVHDRILDQFLENPDDWIELSSGYKPYSRKLAEEKLLHYSPTCGPFHDGRGGLQESIKTFGDRWTISEVPYAIYGEGEKWPKIIGRIGMEPGQALYYYAMAKKKKVFSIPTEVHWLPGKENQQQEYTLNEAGIKHLWAISAYHDYTPESERDVAKLKQSIPDQLYETLPPNQKI